MVSSMRYLALLRGINVGGRTLVKMADLRACVEGLGFDRVSTYIASGNVLFDAADTDAADLETRIEGAIEERFGLPVKVVVLNRAAYRLIVDAVPPAWAADAGVRANVAFVRRSIDAKDVVRELHPDPAVDEVKAVDGAIAWATRRDRLNRSVMRAVIATPAYKEMTVRSLTTALKLRELLET